MSTSKQCRLTISKKKSYSTVCGYEMWSNRVSILKCARVLSAILARLEWQPCPSTDESDSLLDHEPSVWFQQDEDFIWHIKYRDISEIFNWNIHVRLIPLFELGWWKQCFHVGHRRLHQNNQLWPAISSAALNMYHILYKTPCVSNNTCSLSLSCGGGGWVLSVSNTF